jgi:predicted phage-related endonuclease
MTAIRQGTDEWLEARRSLVTATDIPVLLGLSPYKCEADLADEKAGKAQEPPSLRMRATRHSPGPAVGGCHAGLPRVRWRGVPHR